MHVVGDCLDTNASEKGQGEGWSFRKAFRSYSGHYEVIRVNSTFEIEGIDFRLKCSLLSRRIRFHC